MLDAFVNADKFFMGDAPVQHALRALARALDAQGIAYAIGGGMALNMHGHERVTKDVDVILTAEGLEAFKRQQLGRGYVEKFPGSRGLRDTMNNVSIDVLLAGQFPGDGKPKPVAFPDPAVVDVVRDDGVAFVPLRTLIELKLASGMTALHRAQDIADVINLIRARQLPADFVEQLHPYVRDKFAELWTAAQVRDPE